jgi:hypothetical protein
MNEYFIGSEVRLTAKFRNALGHLADPTDPTIMIKEPGSSGTEESHAYPGDVNVVKVSTGVYYFDKVVASEGIWTYRCKSTIGFVSAAENFFKVKHTPFTTP